MVMSINLVTIKIMFKYVYNKNRTEVLKYTI